MKEVQSTMPNAVVEILSGPEKGKVVPVRGDKLTFGRHESCDIRLDGKKVSRNHATIGMRNGKFVITDMGSKNRTRINGEPITEKFLQSGDQIVIGDCTMRFRVEGAGEETVEEAIPPMPGADDDDGTQLVDMNQLLKGASPARAIPVSAPIVEDDGVEKTDMIDINQLLAKSAPAAKPAPARAPAPPDSGRNTPQNIRFARTEEGGNIEEGTDLLNMEDILGESDAPKVREVSPVYLALGAGAIVLVVLVAMIVQQVVFGTTSAVQNEKLVVGQNTIFHLPVNPSNDIARGEGNKLLIRMPDRDMVGSEIFLATINQSTKQKHYHIALTPEFPGETSMFIQYKNGDTTEIRFKVEDAKKIDIPGSREEKIAEAQKVLSVAVDFWGKRQNSAENARSAYLKYREVIQILSRVEFGNLLPEFKQAQEGMEQAKKDLNNRYKDLIGDFELAEKREDRTGAVDVLRKMLELRLDDNDIDYLKNKTRLEYKYSDVVTR